MIQITIPYSRTRDLATAYNEAFQNTTAEWLAFLDWDTCGLHNDQIPLLYKAIEDNPHAGVFLCYTNRINHLAHEQNLMGGPAPESDMKYWLNVAENQLNVTPEYSIVRRTDFSGFFMLISRKTWEKVPCPRYMAKGGLLGVDTMWARAIRTANIPVLRINRLLIFHVYRLNKEITDRTHLM
jgi:GT2 family glycosyltransferase